MTLLLVGIGGGLGASLRFLIARALDTMSVRAVPWGTLAVNLAGSFLLGLLLGADVAGQPLALWGIGFCGGLTTYSTFAVQSVELPPRRGAAYVALTLLGCLLAAWIGVLLGHDG